MAIRCGDGGRFFYNANRFMKQAAKGKLQDGDRHINKQGECLWFKDGKVIECNSSNWQAYM